jgi:hypothetical protein
MRKEDVRKTRNQRYTKYGLDVAERVLQNSLSELEMLERLATRERTNSAEQILWLNRYLHIDEPNPFATLKDDGRDYWTKVEALSFLTSVKDSYGGRIDDILAQSRKNLVNPQRVFPEDRLEGKSFGFDSEYSLEGYRVIRTKILSLAMRAEAYDESVGGYQFIGAYVTLSGDRVLAIALNRKAVPFCYVMMELICARLQAMSVHAKGIENPD